MRLGLVRRGFSSTGGAEIFLRRFSEAVVAAGHEVVLFTSEEWPAKAWLFGAIVRVRGRTARSFADDLQRLQPHRQCDLVFSLERVWECDCYRAGDGVHRAWLDRRSRFESPWRSWVRRWSRKHQDILELEERLFCGGARRVIANSQMVKDEIVAHYNSPAEIAVIYNGIGTVNSPDRTAAREALALHQNGPVILFAGSGWERKGLRFAIKAVEKIPDAVLLVAGRGNPQRYGNAQTRFIGPVQEMQNCLAAADLFLLPTIYDPFSNACLEAAAAGVPVITTRSNGFSEIMTADLHGEIIDDPADVEAIAGAIRKWSNAGKRADAIPRLKQLAGRYDIAGNVEQTLRVIQNARSG